MAVRRMELGNMHRDYDTDTGYLHTRTNRALIALREARLMEIHDAVKREFRCGIPAGSTWALSSAADLADRFADEIDRRIDGGSMVENDPMNPHPGYPHRNAWCENCGY